MTDRGHPPEPERPDDVDRRFREIVAGLGTDLPAGPGRPEGPRRPGPSGAGGRFGPADGVNPPLPGPPPAGPPPAGRPAQDRPQGPPPAGRPRRPGPAEAGGPPEGMATDFRSYSPPEEEDHFVPPPTPPLPAGDLHFWAILVGLVGGPLLVLLSAVLPVLDPGWTGLGAALTVAGFVLLVLRQPRQRHHRDDWGAQV
ncbi:hypothetical protein ACQE98_09345 [Ornithinimicrobium sp. W1679]|uniref:hypothetical protein n=1 Tax=Ornithinimicrobium sp. W1679 TaxID=3418770 RepID=UPI003CF23029